MKKSSNKIWKILGITLLTLFVLANVVAFNHARKFTRYGEPTGQPRTKIDQLSGLKKAWVIFSGIENPKPQNDSVPHVAYETVELGSERKLQGWYLKTPESKGTVIIFHGYSGNKSPHVPHAEILQQLGWDALLIDFYGCGGSDGYESTIGFNEAIDVKTAYDYVRLTSDKPITLLGSSMGSAAIMKAVADETVKPDKLILECPFGNMRSAVDARVKVMGVPSFPFTDLFMFWGGTQNGFWAYNHNPEEYAKQIHIPTLLLYGEKDKRVPRAETDLIYANLAGEKTLVTFPESGHESYLKKYTPEWTQAVEVFLK